MNASQRRRKIQQVHRQVSILLSALTEAADQTDPLEQLNLLHAQAARVEAIRDSLADCKGAAASGAKGAYTHKQIADRLSVSKPYVQQMVYRGRALG